MKEISELQKVVMQVSSDSRFNPEKIVSVNKDITEMVLSPHEKEIKP